MAKLVKHKFVSAIPDGTDATIVRPSNWNDDHDLTGIAESGANTDITSMSGITGTISSPQAIQMDDGNSQTLVAGKLWYTPNTGAWNAGMGNGNITQQIGEELFIYGKASAAITDSPLQIVYHTGTVGASGVITFAPTIAGITDENAIVGVATENIALNGFGRVTTFGLVRGITTNGTAFGETWADDDVIWYNSVTGNPTNVKPSAPNIKFQIGLVVKAGAGGSGSFQVALVQGTQLGGTDSNVKLTTPANGNILTYDGGNGYWKNTNLTAGTGISVSKSANGVLTVTNSSPNTYDPTNVAITGGTINNTVIGATTPAAGTFTTITGQTEVLKGTGTNFITQSNSFTNAAWTVNNTTIATTVATTDPIGGFNAFILTEDTSTSTHRIFSTAISIVNGVTYTYSVYAKNGTRNNIQLVVGGTAFGFSSYANFNISSGTLGTVGATATATITSVGNGWYRCSITVTCIASGTDAFSIYLSDTSSQTRAPTYTGTSTYIYLYGAQSEVGTVTNTYIPTTTTAVYGTPTLSFSGVAGLGLQSDGSLYVSPAGTGALQAQATTSSTVGGNARGANAVDWQTLRSSATQVASATASTIGGGQSNTASSANTLVAGGNANTANANSAAVLGGSYNTASGTFSSIGGGASNTAAGYLNFIGGGYTNSGTALAAVTTQTAATNGVTSGSTAVTLSASNAAIKVGQIVTGTGIVSLSSSTPYTYVAAISGTSLTLSQNANATGTPTLSFYTPHGVVVGGGNNQATGSYSFIGGGGDAGTAANRNVASGDWSVVVGGKVNTASGISSFIGGGGADSSSTYPNLASGTASVIGGGLSNTASAQGAGVLAGFSNTASGTYSSVIGGTYGTTRGIVTNMVVSSRPITGSVGVSQAGLLILARQTTDATPTVLASDANAASTTNQVILPNNSAYYFKVSVISGVTGGGNTKAWTLEGAIKRGAGVGTTAIVGTVTTTVVAADAGASTWTVTATADTVNGGLAITVTGQASTTIRWVAKAESCEMTY